MATKKNADDIKAVKVATFTKKQLLKSEAYFNRRDAVNALLDDSKEYTKEQVDNLLDDFMKKAAH